MKKLFLLLGLLIACGSEPKIARSPAPPPCADAQVGQSCIPSPAAPAASRVIRGDDWSIAVLGNGWEQKETPNAPSTASGFLLVNKEASSVISVFRDQVDPKIALDQEAFKTGFIKKITGEGGTIDFVAIAQLNGKEFTKITMHKSVAKLQVWMRLDNNVAYVVMCGGLAFERQIETDCNKMADTFKIGSTKSRPFMAQGNGDIQAWVAKLASDILNQN